MRDDGTSKKKAARIAYAQADDDRHPAQTGGEAPPYEERTKDELYEVEQEAGVKGRSSMSKAALTAALRER